MNIEKLTDKIKEHFGKQVDEVIVDRGEITIELPADHLIDVCKTLRDDHSFKFDMLVDACGVDYLKYGLAQWQTESASNTGFDRAVEHGAEDQRVVDWNKPRFASVYHLLSTELNHRVRLRVFLDEKMPMVDSVVDIWSSANWFEREAFDMFGILYKGHPDLRRILTDYGFIGHPFRKDFPLSGNVEVRYDATEGRVVYRPVEIKPRILVPKVIREDHRYIMDPETVADQLPGEKV